VFADPQSITYNSVAKSLPAISRGDTQSEYRLAETGGVVYDFTLIRQFKNRNRVVARLRKDAVAADPLRAGFNVQASATGTFTIDFPNVGFLTTEVQDLGRALRDWLSDANILKMLNGET
jgi:hypothetical protein